jgi:holliday junction DNA helicase RuvA
LPSLGAAVDLEIRQVVREESISLYGFATESEKRAFDLLLSVQNVRPKLALSILSVLAPDELAGAIAHADIDRLDAVPGVGAKVAERIVRELRDKLGQLSVAVPPRAIATQSNGSGGAGALMDDALSALVNLGYRPAEARRAVDSVGELRENDGLEELIRKSLAVILGEK